MTDSARRRALRSRWFRTRRWQWRVGVIRWEWYIGARYDLQADAWWIAVLPCVVILIGRR